MRSSDRQILRRQIPRLDQRRPRSNLQQSRTTDHNQPSELVSNGRFLYVGNRGPDSVTVFEINGTLPRYLTEVPVGAWPRHLSLAGDRLYVANERSHSVMVMAINTETGIPTLADTISVPSPTVVLP